MCELQGWQQRDALAAEASSMRAALLGMTEDRQLLLRWNQEMQGKLGSMQAYVQDALSLVDTHRQVGSQALLSGCSYGAWIMVSSVG